MRLQKYFLTNNGELHINDSWDPLRIAAVIIGLFGLSLSLIGIIIILFHDNLHNFFDFTLTPYSEIIPTLFLALTMGLFIYSLESSLIYWKKSIKSKIQESSEKAYSLLLSYGSVIGIMLFLVYGILAYPWLLGNSDVNSILHIDGFYSRTYLAGMACYVAIHSLALIYIEVYRKRERIFYKTDSKNFFQMKSKFIIIPFSYKSNRLMESEVSKTVTLAIFQKISGSKIKHISYNTFIEQNESSNLYILAGYDPIKYKINPYCRIFNGSKENVITFLKELSKFGSINVYGSSEIRNCILIMKYFLYKQTILYD